ncbi:hypothetical protein DUPY_43850 [Duganella phyllosphaerae]|uniref:Uncharacterized protein n=1 Tax=Duganella phyllosphaerae TaxID=762836 RepID=A0A1E7WCF5_9BURK|nr:hypothetical protein DUPY_43850 [Duganella phyllosphaerae]
MPLSNETCTVSPAASAALKVPLTVCAATLVTRSVLLAPLSAENDTPAPVVSGATVSMATGAETAATPALPTASVQVPALTLTVAAPAATPLAGVSRAVYSSGLAVAAKLLSTPLVTCTSPAAKPSGASLNVNTTTVASPSLSAVDWVVMASVGATVSTAISGVMPLPPASPRKSV